MIARLLRRPQRFLRINRVDDGIQNRVQVLEDVAIVNAQNANPFLMQLEFSVEIGCFGEIAGMTRTIEFDRELCLRAEKIDNSIPDWMLTSKLQTGDLSIPQMQPETLFRIGGIFAEISRLFNFH